MNIEVSGRDWVECRSRAKKSSTNISVNLLRRAGLNSRLPKSPEGFMVAKRANFSSAWRNAPPGCSETTRVRSRSSNEFKRSSTLSLAKATSSNKKKVPCFSARRRGPSSHANKALAEASYISYSKAKSLSLGSEDSSIDFTFYLASSSDEAPILLNRVCTVSECSEVRRKHPKRSEVSKC